MRTRSLAPELLGTQAPFSDRCVLSETLLVNASKQIHSVCYPVNTIEDVFEPHSRREAVKWTEVIRFQGKGKLRRLNGREVWKLVAEWQKTDPADVPALSLKFASKFGPLTRHIWRFSLDRMRDEEALARFFECDFPKLKTTMPILIEALKKEPREKRESTVVRKCDNLTAALEESRRLAAQELESRKPREWFVEPLYFWDDVLGALSKIVDIHLLLDRNEDLSFCLPDSEQGAIFVPYSNNPKKHPRCLARLPEPSIDDDHLDPKARPDRAIRRALQQARVSILTRHMADQVAVFPDPYSGRLEMQARSLFGQFLLDLSKQTEGEITMKQCKLPSCRAFFPIFGKAVNKKKPKETCDDACRKQCSRLGLSSK